MHQQGEATGHPHLQRVYDAFGPRIMFWETDITQCRVPGGSVSHCSLMSSPGATASAGSYRRAETASQVDNSRFIGERLSRSVTQSRGNALQARGQAITAELHWLCPRCPPLVANRDCDAGLVPLSFTWRAARHSNWSCGAARSLDLLNAHSSTQSEAARSKGGIPSSEPLARRAQGWEQRDAERLRQEAACARATSLPAPRAEWCPYDAHQRPDQVSTNGCVLVGKMSCINCRNSKNSLIGHCQGLSVAA
jgi:hypothetical protein